ncbi:MAG: tetratricopeptide repeat protein [Acidobacteriia bacterium]|nr:tetratricopeptide repeat protein [Terriglobia bacterium]
MVKLLQTKPVTALLIALLSGLGAVTLMADTDRGVDLYRQGKYADAQTELAKAVETNPDDARAHRYLGLALVEQHKPSEAEPHLNKANELDPSGENKLALARLYVEQKDFDKADALLSDADGPDRDYVRGLLQFGRQQNKEAAASLESYLQKNPDHAYAHYYAGLAYNGAKRPDKMLTQFELFLKLRPDAPEAKKVRAVLSTGH